VIIDTGVLYAAMAPRDRNHAACAKLLQATRELLLPAPVLVELDYFLDAAVVTLAERERQTRIATLDRRHFAAIKPRHVAAFELLP
jgi:predicted nucleic acid-binding protein